MFYDYLIRTGQHTIVQPTISGGSASLMAHGMAVMPGRGKRALLWTWEAQRNWALEATRNLKAGELRRGTQSAVADVAKSLEAAGADAILAAWFKVQRHCWLELVVSCGMAVQVF